MSATGEVHGPSHIVDVLHGLSTEKVHVGGHDDLSVFGKADDVGRRRLMSVIRQLRADGYLDVEVESGSLKVAPRAWDILTGKGAVYASGIAPRSAASVVRTNVTGLPQWVLEATKSLVAARERIAKEQAASVYSILDDRTIERIVSAMPRTAEELAAIAGVPAFLAENHAEVLIAPFATPLEIDNEISSFSLF